MITGPKLRKVYIVVFLVPLFFALAFFVPDVFAQQAVNQEPATDEKQLIQRIKEEVMKELREGEFLREQIQIGIQDHIKKQREAQLAAQAEKAHLANGRAKNVRRVSPERDHIYGNRDAPISLIEYSDFECPYCKRFHSTAKTLVQEYKGKVNWVYRHFPLGFHNPGAQKQAEASECANELGGNDAFWQYADAIYARTRSNGKGFPLANLLPLAKEIGLDAEQFQECLDSEKYAARVKEDFAEGSLIGVTGTPATILLHHATGETMLKAGAQPSSAFEEDIARMLKLER